jgi:ribosome-binding protein aMBF1 (putative translation factor)
MEIAPNQIWRRRDPNGDHVTTFTVRTVKHGRVVGVTAKMHAVQASVANMLEPGGRFEYVGEGEPAQRREDRTRPEKEFVRKSVVDHAAQKRAHAEVVGAAVRRLRMEAGIGRDALAKMIGASKSVLDHVEAGESALSLYHATRIAEALDCTLDDLSPVVADERAA